GRHVNSGQVGGIFVVFSVAVVIVERVAACARRVGDELQAGGVQLLHVPGCLCQGQQVSSADKEDELIFSHRHVVVSGAHFLTAEIVRSGGGHAEHVFRQVYVAAGGVLLADGSQHEALPEEELILHLGCVWVL